MIKPELIIFNQHSSYITVDIANAFIKSSKYRSVILFTGVLNEREVKLDENVKVISTIGYSKKNVFTRLFTWFIAFLHFILRVNIFHRKSELFLVSNPPLITFIPYFCSNDYKTLIFDIYPDALIANNFIKKNSYIEKFWVRSNRLMYKKAQGIYTISEGMKISLSKYCCLNEVKVVNLWSSFKPTYINKIENRFLKHLDLENKFIIMYSGNMGKSSRLEKLIEVAGRMIEYRDIVFLFVGEGWLLEKLKYMVKTYNLTNCMFLPYENISILKESLSLADLSVVSLPTGNESISIPNKTFTLLALGKPILCFADSNSDLASIIIKNGIGQVFGAEDNDQIVEFILKCRSDNKFKQMLIDNTIKAAINFDRKNAENFI